MQGFSPDIQGIIREDFLPRVRGVLGATQPPSPPQYFEKLMQYSPSEAIDILSKTVGGELKGVVFK